MSQEFNCKGDLYKFELVTLETKETYKQILIVYKNGEPIDNITITSIAKKDGHLNIDDNNNIFGNKKNTDKIIQDYKDKNIGV